MIQSLEQITVAALALPVVQRELLVSHLLESMDVGEEVPLSEEWVAEIERRQQEVANGAETFDAEKVFAEIRRDLREKRSL